MCCPGKAFEVVLSSAKGEALTGAEMSRTGTVRPELLETREDARRDAEPEPEPRPEQVLADRLAAARSRWVSFDLGSAA
jgi:hypothetical protein